MLFDGFTNQGSGTRPVRSNDRLIAVICGEYFPPNVRVKLAGDVVPAVKEQAQSQL